jgi:hypothetical protein
VTRRTRVSTKLFVAAILLSSAYPARAFQHCMYIAGSIQSSVTPQCPGGFWDDKVVRISCDDRIVDDPICEGTFNEGILSAWLGQVEPHTAPEVCAPWVRVLNDCDTPGPEECRDPARDGTGCAGDPVNLTSGALEQSATDLDLGRGLT